MSGGNINLVYFKVFFIVSSLALIEAFSLTCKVAMKPYKTLELLFQTANVYSFHYYL